MHDLQPLLTRLGRAIATDARAGRELRHLRRTEMEKTQYQACAGIVAQRDAQQRAITEAALDGFYASLHLRGHARLQLADGGELGAILVTQWQVQPQVLQSHQATGSQLFGHPRPHPGKLAGDGLVEHGLFAARCDWHRTRMPTP